MQRTPRSGFTLVEILVSVTIIFVLATAAYMSFSGVRPQARDSERQSDLRTIQSALELYKQRWGRFPEGCRGANQWSGQQGTSYACSDGSNRYIVGDPAASRGFVPDFMPTLPLDPNLNGVSSGYVYYTNVDGSAYKLMALRTVETETIRIQDNHPFVSCDVSFASTGVCDAVYFNSNSSAPKCANGNAVFRASYGIWGGYPEEPFTSGPRVEEQLENVICRMP